MSWAAWERRLKPLFTRPQWRMQLRAMPLDEVPFSRRVTGALRRLRVSTVSGLLGCTPRDLLAQPGFGPAALEEVRTFLRQRDFALCGDDR